MAENGGYRKPKNPAAVSGPGASSRRTDGRPSEDNLKQAKRYVTGMGYGENKELNEIQSQADMAGASTPQNVSAAPVIAMPKIPISDISPLDAPTQRPEEPFTAGLSSGPGPGPEVMLGTPEYAMSQQDVQKVAFTYGILMRAAEQADSSQATRELARKVRSLLD